MTAARSPQLPAVVTPGRDHRGGCSARRVSRRARDEPRRRGLACACVCAEAVRPPQQPTASGGSSTRSHQRISRHARQGVSGPAAHPDAFGGDERISHDAAVDERLAHERRPLARVVGGRVLGAGRRQPIDGRELRGGAAAIRVAIRRRQAEALSVARLCRPQRSPAGHQEAIGTRAHLMVAQRLGKRRALECCVEGCIECRPRRRVEVVAPVADACGE